MTGFFTRRAFNQLMLATVAGSTVLGSGGHDAQAAELKKFIFATASKTVTPLVAPFAISEYLGYFKEEGLSTEIAVLGSNAATAAAAEQGRIDAIVGVPAFQLGILAAGKPVNFVNYFEYAYPFKWAVAVRPDSKFKSLADLKGRKIGVHNFGTAEFEVGKILLKLSGLEPVKDVTWLAVGEAAGYSLQNGDIDALVYFDTGFGTIEASGIKLAYLPLPPNVPKVGGLYIATTNKVFKERRTDLVGYARGVAKGIVFIEENPEAGSYIFLQMYPEAAPRDKSMQEKVAAIMNPVVKRIPTSKSYDTSVTDLGYISPAEAKDDITFLELQDKVKDSSFLYSNDLIKDINAFDKEAIKRQARAFKLPYKS